MKLNQNKYTIKQLNILYFQLWSNMIIQKIWFFFLFIFVFLFLFL
jgi:ABC-type multidrug transport system permease subunit